MDLRVFPQAALPCAPLLILAASGLALLVFKSRVVRQVACFSIVHLIGRVTLVPLVHELGHAFVASALFNRANPLIHGAYTTYAVSYGLTSLGKIFGREACLGLVAAGGLMATSAWSLLMRKTCRMLAISQLFHEASYCLEALRGCHDQTHDYFRLWAYHDIHPIYPLVWIGTLSLVQLDV